MASVGAALERTWHSSVVLRSCLGLLWVAIIRGALVAPLHEGALHAVDEALVNMISFVYDGFYHH